MIVPSKALRVFIGNMFESQNDFARKFEVDPATLTRYLKEEISCSTGFIEKVTIKTGMDFDMAFEVKKEE